MGEVMLPDIQSMVAAEYRQTFESLAVIANKCIRYNEGKGKCILIDRTDIPLKARRELRPYLIILKDIANAELRNDRPEYEALMVELRDMAKSGAIELEQAVNMWLVHMTRLVVPEKATEEPQVLPPYSVASDRDRIIELHVQAFRRQLRSIRAEQKSRSVTTGTDVSIS